MNLIKKWKGALRIVSLAVIGVVGLWASIAVESALGKDADSSRLVAIRDFPVLEPCSWDQPAEAYSNLRASAQPASLSTALRPASASPLMASPVQQGTEMRPSPFPRKAAAVIATP